MDSCVGRVGFDRPMMDISTLLVREKIGLVPLAVAAVVPLDWQLGLRKPSIVSPVNCFPAEILKGKEQILMVCQPQMSLTSCGYRRAS